MASSSLTPSYAEVSQNVLIEIPEHKQFFTNLFPWDQIEKVARGLPGLLQPGRELPSGDIQLIVGQ